MSAEYVLDTNILIYTFHRDQPDVQSRARGLVETALASNQGIVSHQVVQEFLNVATRKFQTPMTSEAAREYLHLVLKSLCTVFPSISLYEWAIDLSERWRYGVYDSLIIGAALEASCKFLYREDLQAGQKIESLTIINPFSPAG